MAWRIGDLVVDGPVVLGPMSGYTTPAYRDYMKPFGVSLSYTEMVSDMGCIYGMRSTREFIEFHGNEPTGLQLFGSDPDNLVKAAQYALRINPEIRFVDVNMGCPVHKVCHTGAGSSLMREPARCGEIIRALKRNIDVPVTAKIRLGWSASNMNFKDVLEELEAAGADAVCIHPRTRDEQYGGKPHYDLVEGIRREMSVPLTISGNIYLLDDAI